MTGDGFTPPDDRWTRVTRIALPEAPAVVAGHGRAAIFTADGELLLLPAADAASYLRSVPPPIVVHAPATFRRLGLRPMPAFDLLELFAFALPGRPAAPTPRGLALMLDFEPPTGGLDFMLGHVAQPAAP